MRQKVVLLAPARAELAAPPTFHQFDVDCSDTIGGLRSKLFPLNLAFALTGKAVASPASSRGASLGGLERLLPWIIDVLTPLWHEDEGLAVTQAVWDLINLPLFFLWQG